MGGAFAVEGSIEQNELRQVLEALSFFNSEFGYVQGLSFVAATLLRHTALVTQLSKMLRLFFLSFCLSSSLSQAVTFRALFARVAGGDATIGAH